MLERLAGKGRPSWPSGAPPQCRERRGSPSGAPARGRAHIVGYFDADLATPDPSSSGWWTSWNPTRSWPPCSGPDARLGSHIERSPVRHYLGRIFATAASLALGVAVYDTQCGAKVFRVNDNRRWRSDPFRSSWSFDVLLASGCSMVPGLPGLPEESFLEMPLGGVERRERIQGQPGGEPGRRLGCRTPRDQTLPPAMTGLAGLTEVVGEEPAGRSRRTAITPGKRIIDQFFDPRLVNVVTVLGYALPVAGYFWMIQRYSVNVIFGDQWDDVAVIGHSYFHLFDWGSLWAQHNENRIFFPNLIVVLLAHTTHFNIQVEEYLSAVMLVVATGLLISDGQQAAGNLDALALLLPGSPVGLLPVQYENSLWGFQMAWYLVMLSLAAAIFLVDRPTLTWLGLAAAIVAGVVGSFSSLQGLLIWPAGLVLLYHRRRAAPFVVAWIVAARGVAGRLPLQLQHQRHVGLTEPRDTCCAIRWRRCLCGRRYRGPASAVQRPPGSNAVLLLGLVILILAGLVPGDLWPPP